MVGSSAVGLSVSRKMVAKSGGSSRYLQQRVSSLLHEVGVAEDVHPFAPLRRPVVNLANDVPHLVNLYQHLRRVGRNNRHVRMRLHEDASLAFIGVAQVLSHLDCLGKTALQVVRPSDANAVGTMPAEVRQPVGRRPLQTVHRLGDHLRQRELARALRPRQDHGMGKAIMREHLADGVNHVGIAVKVREGHVADYGYIIILRIVITSTVSKVCHHERSEGSALVRTAESVRFGVGTATNVSTFYPVRGRTDPSLRS